MIRRDFNRLLAAAPALPVFTAEAPWSAEWDRAIILAAVSRQEKNFDSAESMLRSELGAEYRYHTALRDQTVHPTRDSLDYALLLLEAGGAARQAAALKIIDRVLSLQDTDPASKWYGIWGWYMEEPPQKMSPADWNWADFLGSLLLLIENRHGKKLPAGLRGRVREAVRHAAHSVRRRNVTMSYTNIAVKGTFVTKAAAELLGDKELEAYADDRLQRLAAEIDKTGSFAEYNSPTYALVSIVNFTRFRMVVKDAEARARFERLHDRMWLHFAQHWHPPTRQFAGPMSRCYRTLLTDPVWLQKALGGRLTFLTLPEVKRGDRGIAGETGYLDLRCPSTAADLFLNFRGERQHREVFIPARGAGRPVQGVTWLAKSYSLGTANRSEFWVQRRPLVAYWGDPAEGVRYLQLRFVKDDYDFSSAMFFSVQNRNAVLGLVSFMSPGGDKHPGLDPIKDGEFTAKRFYLEFLFDGLRREPAVEREQGALGPVTVKADGMQFTVSPRYVTFPGGRMHEIRVERESGKLRLQIELLPGDPPAHVRWREVKKAGLVFTLLMEPGGQPTDKSSACEIFEQGSQLRARWQSPRGLLEIAASLAVQPAAQHHEQFDERIDGQPVPAVRLAEQKLA